MFRQPQKTQIVIKQMQLFDYIQATESDKINSYINTLYQETVYDKVNANI